MKPPHFKRRIKPWAHQVEALELSWAREYFALMMEQGTGKTKVVIETAAALNLSGNIDGVLIAAPDGVQEGWVADALPAHMPAEMPYTAAIHRNQQSKANERAVNRVTEQRLGLAVLAMGYDQFATVKGAAVAKEFLRVHRAMFVADEAHKIKSKDAARTKAVVNLSKYARYRRTMTGTPAAQSPFDLFTQFQFLDPDILGTRSFVAFKCRYGVIEDSGSYLNKMIVDRLVRKYGEAQARAMAPKILKRDADGNPMYRNLDQLYALIAPHSYRKLKIECMDLPPKVYEKRHVKLTPEQRRIYDELVREMMVEYEGGLLTATLAITRYQRLQQITGGFFKRSKEARAIPIKGGNPKLAALLDEMEACEGKAIIWAHHVDECEAIAHALSEAFGARAVVRYWGAIGKADRERNRVAFRDDPSVRFFVGNQAAGGTGLDGLQVASTVVYYSNDTSLTNRLQSEDRAHRGGSEVHDRVTIIDIIADDTLDEKFLNALRARKNVADLVVGDDPREWV